LDSYLNVIWAESWGGTETDTASSIAIDSAGNPIVAGTYSKLADFDPDPNRVCERASIGDADHEVLSWFGTDGYLSKFSPDGVFQWVRVWGYMESMCGSTAGEAPAELLIDSDDRIHVAGRLGIIREVGAITQAAGYNSSMYDTCCLRIYSDSGDFLTEGIDADFVDAIAQGTDGSIYLTGNTSLKFDVGGKPVFEEDHRIIWFDGFVFKARLNYCRPRERTNH
jgi:hypothetical protein